ncbi:MAG: hypothetical protein HMLIMOIP_001223 [Candidatus Nitrosomirales archaeon]|jgi:hypothetical protein
MTTKLTKTIVVTSFAILLPISGLISVAYADQPYIGGYGYFGTTIYHIDKGQFNNYFFSKNGNPGQDLLSVLSLAGSTGTSGTGGVNGFVYQVVNQWDTDGSMYNPDQVWGPNSAFTSWGQIQQFLNIEICKKVDLNHITGNAYFNSDKSRVLFGHTCYKNDSTSVTATNSYLKKFYESTTYFLFGECKGSSCYSGNGLDEKFFQFAAEAPDQTGNFQLKQNSMFFVDSYDFSPPQTKLLSGYNARLYQGASDITWWTNYQGIKISVYVGGITFNNVYPQALLTDGSQSAGTVQWDARTCSPNPCKPQETSLW